MNSHSLISNNSHLARNNLAAAALLAKLKEQVRANAKPY